MLRFVVFFLTFVASFTALANAAIVTVTATGDAGSGVCSATTCTLRDAINSAAPGDTITFANTLSYPATITLGGQELLIYKDLTIIGPGAAKLTIDANQQSRIFEIANLATVSVSGLHLTHGRVVGAAGASAAGATATSGSDAHGGAIIVDAGSTLQVDHCVLVANTVTGGPGGGGEGVGATGGRGGNAMGGAIFSEGTLVVSASTLSNNQASGGYGGAGLPPPPATAGNGGAASGGAVYAAGNTDISNSQLLRNMVIGGASGFIATVGTGAAHGGDASGGAIDTSGFVTLSSVTAAGNTATGGFSAVGTTNGAATGVDIATSATLLTRNSVFADAASGTPTCVAATLSTQGTNLVGDSSCTGPGVQQSIDAKLQIIDATPTAIAFPVYGSPLIDMAGDCKDAFGATLTHDVRGVTRPLDGNADGVAACDIGAVESDELFANGFD